MTRHWRIAAAATLLALALTGCSIGEAPIAPPTGDELVEQARQHYFDYRTVTNDVQTLIFDGPWEADIGSYGMQPSPEGCGDGTYQFDLTRTTHVPKEEQDAARERVLGYLTKAGYEFEGQDLGSGDSRSTDLIVNRQGDFSQLMVTFIANGSVLVTAITQCWPGDADALSDLIFGDVNLAEGYLPTEESPSDPLFFGITPGEPAYTGK